LSVYIILKLIKKPFKVAFYQLEFPLIGIYYPWADYLPKGDRYVSGQEHIFANIGLLASVSFSKMCQPVSG
jgi:hypothetical protein